MKTINLKYLLGMLVLILLIAACKPDDDLLRPASFPNNPLVFIDDFSAGLQYAAFAGSDVTAFDIDRVNTYNNTAASMQFAVPDFGAPEGTYAGGAYYVDGGRDLSSYTALTFYAKASRTAVIDVLGFGIDLGENKYQVTLNSTQVNTNWKKFYIPIPDPSKLTGEKGMFFYSDGPDNGEGYTFWIDEVQFENVGLLAHPKSSIMGGDDVVSLAYLGLDVDIRDVSYSINLPDGTDQAFTLSKAYFDLNSSNENVVRVTSDNDLEIVGPGLALIRASLGDVDSEGSLTLNVQGTFQLAPEPTLAPSQVISIFSDSYTDVPVDYYNGFWAPFQTTLSEDFVIDGNRILNYTNFNFVGTMFSNPTVDASLMTHLHLDIFIPGSIQPNTNLTFTLRDFGPDGSDGGGDDSDLVTTLNSGDLSQGVWNAIDIPLAGLSAKSRLGLIIYEGNALTNFYVDNIYFYN